MAILTEGKYLNDILKWELEKQQSREIVNITEGQSLVVGEVVGKVTLSVPTTGTAAGGNTGDGLMASVVGGAQTKLGTYTLTCVAEATGAGTFNIITPAGNSLPDVTVAVAYSNSHLGFTISNGATAEFDIGDIFTVEVTAGAGGVMVLTPAAVDGSQKAHGVLIDDYTNTAKTAWAVSTAYALNDIVIPTTANSHTYKCTVAGTSHSSEPASWPVDGSTVAETGGVTWVDQGTIPASKGVAIVRDAQIVEANLTFPTGITNAQKAIAMKELKEKSIVTREEA